MESAEIVGECQSMNQTMEQQIYKSERLAYWYFRLNGFLTTENFVVHPDRGHLQRTDADILAVRFSHRAENLEHPMEDDPKVTECSTFANVIIAEIKTGQCNLNGPWSKPEERNMQRVLKAIGCVPESAINIACEELYEKGFWGDSMVTIRLFAIGEFKNNELTIPLSQQLTWREIISFCINRFKKYEREKSSVPQWTDDGSQLRKCSLKHNPELETRRLFGLKTDNGLHG